MKKLVLLPHLYNNNNNNNNNKFATNLIHSNAKLRVKFNVDFLKKTKVTYNHGPIVNIYIVYKLSRGI